MRFLIAISSVILAVNLALGQSAFTLQIYDSDSNKFVTGAYGEIQYNSSAITNQFARTFYQGEYLTKEIRNHLPLRSLLAEQTAWCDNRHIKMV